MEITVLVDGRPRVVSGITEKTTCKDLVTTLARFRSQPGVYTLLLMRDSFNDGSGAVTPVFIPANALIVDVMRKWHYQVASRPLLKFPATGCLVLVLQQPGHAGPNGSVARRRRAILQMETKEQAARLRVVTKLAKQLDAENRQLLLEAESYGDESISPSKSLLSEEMQRVSHEIKELESAGLPELLMTQRETERSLRQAINRYQERIGDVEKNIEEIRVEQQQKEQSAGKTVHGDKNGLLECNGKIIRGGDTTVGSAPAPSFASPVWV